MPQDGKKMIFDRIQSTENFFGDLCSELSSFTKKKARLRDKYDELARIFKGYTDTSRFNETLFNGLLNFSKSCTFLADSKDMEVQRLQLKTLRDMANYENVCKNARETLKQSLLARGKEQLKHRPQQRNSIVEKDSSSQIAEESKQDFEMNLLRFERQKIADIREMLLDFTLIQLKESVKSMEILTAMYNDVAAIDENMDVQEFEEKFLNKGSNNLKASNRSQSMSALATKSQPLKRGSLSNSTMSLSSPNKDLNLKDRGNRSSDSESEEEEEDDDEEEEESLKSSEETTESEDEDSRDSSMTKPSTVNASSVNDDDDDDAVEIRPIKTAAKKKVGIKPQPEKRAAPVPQVRFSKLVSHMKK